MSTAVAVTPTTAAAPEEEKVEKYQFDNFFQTKIAALVMREPLFVQRTDGLIRPEYFESGAEAFIVDAVLTYYRKYKRIPGDGTMLAHHLNEHRKDKKLSAAEFNGVRAVLPALMKSDLSDADAVVDAVAKFARHQAVAQAMAIAIGKLDKLDFEGIEKVMKKALDVGAHADHGAYDFEEEVDQRFVERQDRLAGKIKPSGITTGYEAINKCLYQQGWGRKELSVLLGAAKMGKTTALMDFGINAMMDGHNVLYLTLEVSKMILADRMDACISQVVMHELGAKVVEVRDKVRSVIDALKAKGTTEKPGIGKFIIQEFPTGMLMISNVRRLLERFKSRGIKFDLVIVDYADLMSPERYSENTIENSKSVYVGLRGLAMQEDIAVLTATQTNREGYKSAVAKAEHVADDFNKIRIADVVISINRTEEERAMNQARLYFAACRNQPAGFSIRIEQALDRMKFCSKIIGFE